MLPGSHGEQFSPLALWPPQVRFACDASNSSWTNKDIDWCEATFAPILPAIPEQHRWLFSYGRLGQSIEGRAKRRVF
uniref:Uncharacterized protein n=1 Tax=Utricularia reniformis TaxID=192314 RepID=A0A1Y0AZR6_9LAMI|nr:hypothetical protein AEK19_MT0409 [Utricularia reniformis]ART30676.1 hypothetical protein AEK19_MT0409 [Utricularia reniformis]